MTLGELGQRMSWAEFLSWAAYFKAQAERQEHAARVAKAEAMAERMSKGGR